MRLPIRLKMLLVLTVFTVLPLAMAAALLLPSYGRAVRNSEERYQLIVVAEVSAAAEQLVGGALADAQTVAGAVGEATQLDDANAALAEPLIRAALATRAHIDVARLEIPGAKIDTVLSKKGADSGAAPRSSLALRKQADAAGMAFDTVDETRGRLVVPVRGEHAQRAYITVPVYLAPIRAALERVAENRGLDDQSARMVIVDGKRRAIASFGLSHGAGADLRALPVWEGLGLGAPQGTSLGLKAEPVIDGVPMVAAIHTMGTSGWAVALWQPRDAALAEYARIRRLLFMVAAGVLVVGLLAGFVAASTVTRPILALAHEAQIIGRRAWSSLSPPLARKDELGDLSSAVRKMADDLQLGEAEIAKETKLRGDLTRFMSQEVVDGIIAGDHPLELGGKRADVTVIFADMVAFTKASETMPPEQVMRLLNELFTVLTEVVFRHHGTVDKFIGDCLMGVWGAPVADPDHAAHAMEAAEDMMSFLEAGAEKWKQRYGIEVRLAIGINSGSAIVGNVGSDKRMDYTVVGDVVNVAARLEAIAAPNQVLVGENTHAALDDSFELRLLGGRKLTGRTESVQVYELQV